MRFAASGVASSMSMTDMWFCLHITKIPVASRSLRPNLFDIFFFSLTASHVRVHDCHPRPRNLKKSKCCDRSHSGGGVAPTHVYLPSVTSLWAAVPRVIGTYTGGWSWPCCAVKVAAVPGVAVPMAATGAWSKWAAVHAAAVTMVAVPRAVAESPWSSAPQPSKAYLAGVALDATRSERGRPISLSVC